SFEQTLPIDSCREVAGQLLFIRNSSSCTP
ncbi:DUF1871 family protein, partial [Bacillus subtilis]